MLKYLFPLPVRLAASVLIVSAYLHAEDKPPTKFSFGAHGGLNAAAKSKLHENDTGLSYTNFAFGVDAWSGNLAKLGSGKIESDLQVGLLLGYVPVFTYTDSVSGKKTSDIKYPVVAEARLAHSSGAYAGIGAGYAYTVLTTIGITEGTGGAVVAEIFGGWRYQLKPFLSLGVGLKTLYFFQQVAAVDGTKTNNSQINFFPSVEVSYHL